VVWIEDHHEMITTAWANPTPWKSPRETTEEKLAEIIGRMTSKVQRMESCIFNLHCPPCNTPIDVAPELDETLKPKVGGGGGVSMVHVGSVAVRQVIEKNQPLLGIHGHIHEFRTHGAYVTQPGSVITTSSPGLTVAMRAANIASLPPTVTITSPLGLAWIPFSCCSFSAIASLSSRSPAASG